MDIQYALLGFLSWKPATGYELKKMIAEAVGFEWSGNNNQIYTSLVRLHKNGLVTNEVEEQERYPAKKIYTITEAGREALRNRLTDTVDPPQLRKDILVQLAWADQLGNDELLDILNRYRYETEMQLLMLRQRMKKGTAGPARTERETYLWKRIADNYAASYETELVWVEQTIEGIENEDYRKQ